MQKELAEEVDNRTHVRYNPNRATKEPRKQTKRNLLTTITKTKRGKSMQIRDELLEKLVNAMQNEEVVMIIVSGPGVQLSDWRQLVDVRDISGNGNVLLFEGNMEVYLNFDELNVDYNEEDNEYILSSLDERCEINLRVGL